MMNHDFQSTIYLLVGIAPCDSSQRDQLVVLDLRHSFRLTIPRSITLSGSIIFVLGAQKPHPLSMLLAENTPSHTRMIEEVIKRLQRNARGLREEEIDYRDEREVQYSENYVGPINTSVWKIVKFGDVLTSNQCWS